MLLGNTKPAIGQWFVGNTDFCRMVPLLFIRVHRDWENFVRSKPGFWETSGCKVSGSYIPPQNQSIIHISAVKKHDRLKEWRVLTVFAGVYERDIFFAFVINTLCYIVQRICWEKASCQKKVRLSPLFIDPAKLHNNGCDWYSEKSKLILDTKGKKTRKYKSSRCPTRSFFLLSPLSYLICRPFSPICVKASKNETLWALKAATAVAAKAQSITSSLAASRLLQLNHLPAKLSLSDHAPTRLSLASHSTLLTIMYRRTWSPAPGVKRIDKDGFVALLSRYPPPPPKTKNNCI